MANDDSINNVENSLSIIQQMKELRIKYYPNVQVDNFSPEDRFLYETLENDLQAIIEASGPNSGLEEEKNVMICRTNPVIPNIDKDSYENEAHSVYLIQQAAQGAADIELMAIQQGDYTKVRACAIIRDRAFAEFKSDSYMGSHARKELEEYRQTVLALAHKEAFDRQLEYYKQLDFNDENVVEKHEKDFKFLCGLLDTVDNDYESKNNAEKLLQEAKQAKIQEREQREKDLAKQEEQQQRSEKEQAEQAQKEAELRAFMAQAEEKARKEMEHTNDLIQNPWKAVIENFQVLESITDEDKKAEKKNEMCKDAMVSLISKQEKNDMSAIIQGFSSMYGEEFYQVLINFGELTQENIELAARITILKTSVNKWKEKGFASTSDLDVFLKETTISDINYIIDLYGFNLYEDFTDFKKQYKSFCGVLSSFSRSENENIRQCINQRFGDIQPYELLLMDEKSLKQLYEKGTLGFGEILQDNDVDFYRFEDLEEKFWEETLEDNAGEVPVEEVPEHEVPVEEVSEDETPVEEISEEEEREGEKERPPIPQPEIITPKHMQAGWHMRSIEKMEIEAGLREKSGAKKGPPQKIKPKDIRKHMQDDWQMESVEDMEYKAGIISKDELKVIKEEKEKAREAAEKELARQEAKDNKSWIARFKKWHDQSKDISIAERNTMSEVIVRQIKEAERSTRDKIQNERD